MNGKIEKNALMNYKIVGLLRYSYWLLIPKEKILRLIDVHLDMLFLGKLLGIKEFKWIQTSSILS